MSIKQNLAANNGKTVTKQDCKKFSHQHCGQKSGNIFEN